MIVDELIALIDQTYPTNASAASRAVAGFPVGGAGAVRLSLLHPGLFCGAGSWGGGMRQESDELVAAAGNLKDKDFAFLLVNGDQDHPDAYDSLTTRFAPLGIAHKVTVLKDTPHILGLYYERAGAEMTAFLGKQLRKRNHVGIPRMPCMQRIAYEAWSVTMIAQISKEFVCISSPESPIPNSVLSTTP